MNSLIDYRTVSPWLSPNSKKKMLTVLTPEDLKIRELQAEVEAAKLERQLRRENYAEEIANLEAALARTTEAFTTAHEEFHRDFSIRQYTPSIKHNKLPSYIVILQAKVLRNVHHLCVVDSQYKMMQSQAEKLTAHIKKSARELSEEGAREQMDLVNQMMRLQGEEEEMREGYMSTVRRQSTELVELKKQLPKNQLRRDSSSITTNTTASTSASSASIWDDTEMDLDRLVDSLTELGTRIQNRKVILHHKESLTLEDVVLGEDDGKNGENKSFTYGSKDGQPSDSDLSLKAFSDKLASSFTQMLWSNTKNEMVSI